MKTWAIVVGVVLGAALGFADLRSRSLPYMTPFLLAMLMGIAKSGTA
jgi:hypothetical protein